MVDLTIISVILALVIVNGLFVGAEFALIRAPRTAIKQLADGGGWVPRVLSRVLQSPRRQDRYIVTTQLCVTSASIGLGMYGEHALAQRLADGFSGLGSMSSVLAHSIASVTAIVICTFLHVVVGEMVPKSLALARPQRFSLAMTPFVLVLSTVLAPFVFAVEWLSNRVLRQFGVRRLDEGVGYTTEDLRHIVAESSAGGALTDGSGSVVNELFDFSELTAGAVMVPRVGVQGIRIACAPSELATVLGETRHTRYPVYDGDLDHIVGVAHTKDLLRLLRERKPVHRAVARPVPFVPETSTLERVLTVMQQQRTHMAIVMDEHGGTAGVVTTSDVFEEVVDIEEVGTDDEQAARVDALGAVDTAGTLRLDELSELLGMTVDREDTDTVSGLVLGLLERPAQSGDRVAYAGLEFTVTEVEGHGVGRCRVVPLPVAADEDGETD